MLHLLPPWKQRIRRGVPSNSFFSLGQCGSYDKLARVRDTLGKIYGQGSFPPTRAGLQYVAEVAVEALLLRITEQHCHCATRNQGCTPTVYFVDFLPAHNIFFSSCLHTAVSSLKNKNTHNCDYNYHYRYSSENTRASVDILSPYA